MNLTPLTPSPPSAVRPSSSTSTNTSTSVPRRRRRPFNCPRELHDVDEVCNVRLDKLQQDGFPHKSLPLDVKITSTSVEQHHVVYHVTVSSRTTKDSWVVSYRYRQFLYLKSRVEDTHSCRSSKCTGSCVAIRSILEALFPRQRLISSAFPYIVTKRARAFENVLRYLLGCVLLPGSAMKCTEARGGLTLVLFQFLRVVDPPNQRTLLQTYVDNHSRHNDATSTPTAAAASECIICLEDLSQTSSDSTESPGVVRLSCHHAFHRDCLLEWLLVETHCPMCRSSVVPKAVAQYCVVQAKADFDGRLQGTTASQWWLEDFAEDPLK